MTQPISYVAAPMRGINRGAKPVTPGTVRPTRTATAAHSAPTTVQRSAVVAAVVTTAGPSRVSAQHAGAAVAAAVTGSTAKTVARPTTGLLWPPGGWSRK